MARWSIGTVLDIEEEEEDENEDGARPAGHAQLAIVTVRGSFLNTTFTVCAFSKHFGRSRSMHDAPVSQQ